MITKEEIARIASAKNLTSFQIEKDYVLGWILAGIAHDSALSKSWIFKGGTCVHKCYFDNYRYSEDLDFTVTEKISVQAIQNSIQTVCLWVSKATGIEIDLDRTLFEVIENASEQSIIQGRIFYRGPVSPTSKQQWPRIKFDLTSDEVIVDSPEKRKIIHPYSDNANLTNLEITTYTPAELLAEKIRALFERTRPRDLYDVVELFNATAKTDHQKVRSILMAKCKFKKISNLHLNQLKLDSCKAGWHSQLAHQVHNLPDFEYYFDSFNNIHLELGLA